MPTTAEAYGFGARAPYAAPRASDYEMKERVRLSGLFPRVRNEPLSTQLQALLKDFEQNAALTGILERRRRLEERMQFELKGREGIDALNRNLAPPFRAGLAGAAVSADVADRLARSQEAGALAPAADASAAAAAAAAPKAKAAAKVRIRKPAAKAAAVVGGGGGPGVSGEGGSTGSGTGALFGEPPVPTLGPAFAVQPAGAAKAAPAGAAKAAPGTGAAKAAPGTGAAKAAPGPRRSRSQGRKAG